jgi:dienelactone hydrolase
MPRSPRFLVVLALLLLAGRFPAAEPLLDTKTLTWEGDLAARMVAGIDTYLMRELKASGKKRQALWKVDTSSEKAYLASVRPHRERLAKILGVVDKRLPVRELEYIGGTEQPSLVAQMPTYTVHAVRWPVLPGVDGEGLLLEPRGKAVANIVAIPEADWTPEMLVGLEEGVPPRAQFARHLAENGCRVIVPVLINRKDTFSGNPAIGRMTNQPHREFLYRMAYEMGRHVIGYEVQKVLAAVDWFTRDKGHAPVGLYGYGEGGMLALYAAALDQRIQATVVSGYLDQRENLWQEPIYHNVWDLLTYFDDVYLALLVAPRSLVFEFGFPPENHVLAEGRPPARPGRRTTAAPGRQVAGSLNIEAIKQLMDRISGWNRKLTFLEHPPVHIPSVEPEKGPPPQTIRSVPLLLKLLAGVKEVKPAGKPPVDRRKGFDPAARQKRQFDQLVAFTQKLMRDSRRYRDEHFWAKLDTSSLANYEKSIAPFREQFRTEVIGKLPDPKMPLNPRSRLAYDTPKWKGYQVVLDVYPDVFAYGVLLIPRDLKPGERRPVVVCQHGLEGRPADVVNPKERTRAYNSFGAQLADLGYIVYAPQNPYIGRDDFRVLQRKANPLGLSLFSFIVRQHERTTDWLATLPFVDPERIAFYGLSYGGKTAMRVPALVPRYCLSICAGDFNEWVEKNVSADFPGSYMFTFEYEMYEFDLGYTFNYAEMAALIAPRPFMVERGHDDGVGIDEMVAYEYAKVRRLYSRLKIPERTEIEFFAGRHEIHGQGTFRFLRKHLGFPKE